MSEEEEEFERTKNRIISNLKTVYDPEIPVNIYDLGLIYGIHLSRRENYLYVYIEMTLTSPACPVAQALLDQVQYVTQAVEEVDEVTVKLTFDPPWGQEKMSEEALLIMAASGAII